MKKLSEFLKTTSVNKTTVQSFLTTFEDEIRQSCMSIGCVGKPTKFNDVFTDVLKSFGLTNIKISYKIVKETKFPDNITTKFTLTNTNTNKSIDLYVLYDEGYELNEDCTDIMYDGSTIATIYTYVKKGSPFIFDIQGWTQIIKFML